MGAGFHGGFGATQGAKKNTPVTKASDVIYDKVKIENYLLNESHPHGGSKAKFMKEVLGYTRNDAKLFHDNIVASITNKKPTSKKVTPYGTKYTYHTQLAGKNGVKVSANVVVVIQQDNGAITYRIITVYPERKVK